MNRVSKRSVFALVLAFALLAGLVQFCVRYVVDAGQWVTYPGSPHLYTGSNLNTGVVFDRAGQTLLDSADGRAYDADAEVRAATIHLLGDRDGYIPSPLLDHYASRMIGYSRITGVSSAKAGTGRMTMTIDANVQAKALQLLAGRAGTIGVYNYKTGEILCSVTSPTYDPDNVPDVAGDTTGQYDGVYVNRFLNAKYIPGSIFKLVTAAAAIENISDIDSQTFTCEGSYEVGGQKITCEGVHGQIGFTQALAQSCNCAFGQIAQQLGIQTMETYAEKLGITAPLEFDGLKTAAGNLDLAGATQGDLAWTGIGQHNDQINACQYMTLMGAIAAGGKTASPYYVSEITLGDHTAYTASQKTLDYGLKQETTQRLAQMMRNNVETIYGAGQFGSLTVCAKSGTAEVGGDQTPNAMFAGFVQDDAYPLAFIVAVEHGGSGSATCAPIAAAVLQACAAAMDAG